MWESLFSIQSVNGKIPKLLLIHKYTYNHSQTSQCRLCLIMSPNMRKRTFWHVAPVKIQISLLIWIFAGHILNCQGCKISLSNWNHADLNLHLAYVRTWEGTFSQAAAHISRTEIKTYKNPYFLIYCRHWMRISINKYTTNQKTMPL